LQIINNDLAYTKLKPISFSMCTITQSYKTLRRVYELLGYPNKRSMLIYIKYLISILMLLLLLLLLWLLEIIDPYIFKVFYYYCYWNYKIFIFQF